MPSASIEKQPRFTCPARRGEGEPANDRANDSFHERMFL
jgi:hypothetical protein